MAGGTVADGAAGGVAGTGVAAEVAEAATGEVAVVVRLVASGPAPVTGTDSGTPDGVCVDRGVAGGRVDALVSVGR